MSDPTHANAYAEARRRAHTPRTLSRRVGIPPKAARLVLEDLTNRGELVEMAPDVYGGKPIDMVRIWAIPALIVVALILVAAVFV